MKLENKNIKKHKNMRQTM